MIPPFTADGLLPPGVHRAMWAEFVARFAQTAHRRRLIGGLQRALAELRLAGCARAYVDGSFVTAKVRPGDYDLCYEPRGMDPHLLDPVFFDFRAARAAQKAKFFGELFPAAGQAATGYTYLQFFQQDTTTGVAKGIVALDPRGVP